VKESTYLRSVNKKLPKTVYVWKIADQFTSGVPDCWYSSPDGDLFVEWKYTKSLKRSHTPQLSELQKLWLNERHAEGRNVAVIVGSTDGCLILTDGKWNAPQTINQLLSKEETAAWIAARIRATGPNAGE
jgi:hypothetical protein